LPVRDILFSLPNRNGKIESETMNRTSQGRVATELNYKKLGLKADKGRQTSLI
jgi:hypothetical protein